VLHWHGEETESLDGLLPEPLADVPEREAEQRVRVAELLDGLDE
jgi:hypothetical protein